jgi:LPXTG-site transpeptidase (sortase) family protein
MHRNLIRALTFLMLISMALPMVVSAQDVVTPRQVGEVPTTGGSRPGPSGTSPGDRKTGALPVTLRVDSVGIEAPIEQQEIIDGVMQNPSGPFVVSWYKETGRLGEINNIVMAGHLDYWDVGEAIFYNVWKVKEGDIVQVLGKDDVVYDYSVDWVKNFKVDELTPESIQENIVGPTSVETLTLITCGGPFDYAAGEYEERIVVRATRVVSE